jgi:hypothetical protein
MSDRPILLFCGSRTWEDRSMIRRDIALLPEDAILVHGGAKGADTIAGQIARQRGLHVAVIDALWHTHGKQAGRERNEAMLALKPTQVYAYLHGQSPGTRMMIRLAEADPHVSLVTVRTLPAA